MVVPAGAHHTSLISEMKTAVGSDTRFMSTGTRGGLVGVGAGVAPGDTGIVAGTCVGVSAGSGVTSSVATVGRSGGGSSHSSTCATTRLNA